MLNTIVKQTINSTASRVYTAWSDPSELSKWFTTNAVHDFKVGGEYSNSDNDKGVFLDIVKNKMISFTWENPDHCPGTEVIVDFKELSPEITELTITHKKLSSEEHVNGMNKGWSWAVYSLKSYLETGKPVDYLTWERTVFNSAEK